jgi:phosphatidylglycerophosphatase A
MLATCYPLGCVRVAPGTFGSLLGVVLCLLLQQVIIALTGWQEHDTAFGVSGIFLSLLLTASGWMIIHKAAPYFEKCDDGRIVIDEVVGQFLALFWLPRSLSIVLSSFILFRMLDIFKPWPISVPDRRFKSALGVLLDDVLAGLVAAGGLALVLKAFS